MKACPQSVFRKHPFLEWLNRSSQNGRILRLPDDQSQRGFWNGLDSALLGSKHCRRAVSKFHSDPIDSKGTTRPWACRVGLDKWDLGGYSLLACLIYWVHRTINKELQIRWPCHGNTTTKSSLKLIPQERRAANLRCGFVPLKGKRSRKM